MRVIEVHMSAEKPRGACENYMPTRGTAGDMWAETDMRAAN